MTPSPDCPPGPTSTLAPACTANPPNGVTWADPARQAVFARWLSDLTPAQALLPETLRTASADASFRRYLRLDTRGGPSRIVMDAPPNQEDCRPFVHVSQLMAEAGIHAPRVLAWDETEGFMLLTDLGEHTMMHGIAERLSLDAVGAPVGCGASGASGASGARFSLHATPDETVQNWYGQAIDALLAWQLASRPGALPEFTQGVLQREMQLYPEWYLQQHKAWPAEHNKSMQAMFALIAQQNASAPKVFVHCDYMPRNLILPGPASPHGLGVLDFQDALYGPITYDIASLMRDAFLSWDEAFVLDITVRYWERAKKAGLITNGVWGDWADDFGAFYRAVDYMALQRHLRIAGVFARLTLRDGKPKYLADAPRFTAYIRATASRYRELKPLLNLVEAADGVDAGTAYLRGFGL